MYILRTLLLIALALGSTLALGQDQRAYSMQQIIDEVLQNNWEVEVGKVNKW